MKADSSVAYVFRIQKSSPKRSKAAFLSRGTLRTTLGAPRHVCQNEGILDDLTSELTVEEFAVMNRGHFEGILQSRKQRRTKNIHLLLRQGLGTTFPRGDLGGDVDGRCRTRRNGTFRSVHVPSASRCSRGIIAEIPCVYYPLFRGGTSLSGRILSRSSLGRVQYLKQARYNGLGIANCCL